MSKEPKTYKTIQLREFASRLRLVAARIEQGVEAVDSQGIKQLEVSAWKSGELGIKNFLAFARSVNDAVDLALLAEIPIPSTYSCAFLGGASDSDTTLAPSLR